MPRTLPAALTTVMDSGIYEPYLRVIVNDDPVMDGNEETIQPIAFVINDVTADVTIPWTDNPCSHFRLVRGAVISGSPVTISTSWFYVSEFLYNGRTITLRGQLLRNEYQEAAADSTYEDVIEYVIGQSSEIADPTQFSYEGTAAWKNYKFYPAGEPIIVNSAPTLFSMLRQKYLVFATDGGYDDNLSALSKSTIHFFVATQNRDTDYEITDPIFNYSSKVIKRRLVWRDENDDAYALGAATDPVHNLGYLESTANDPYDPTPGPSATCPHVGSRSSKLPVHLKRMTGDKVSFLLDDNLSPGIMRVKVTEVFQAETTPAWYQIVEALIWFSGAEGAPQPDLHIVNAPRKNVGPFNPIIRGLEPIVYDQDQPDEIITIIYSPLHTGRFSRALSTNDSNIQEAFETLDRHDHDADYAPIAEGVTNGDSHDHSGGDGAQIDFTTLSNPPTAETNANDIYAVASPGGVSAFAGTIATLPGGATLTYNVTSGQEGAMVPVSTSQLAKMRLYNTTRGTSALISNCVIGTNTITLTANVPAGWQVGDTITIASQTVIGGGFNWVDLEITSALTGKSSIFIHTVYNDAGLGATFKMHPFEASLSASKYAANAITTAGQWHYSMHLYKLISNIITLAWGGNPTGLYLREMGYIK